MLSKLQNQASDKITEWFHSSDQYFVLAGFAGTGKTFLIQHAMDKLGINLGHVLFATFTGKASLVLTQKAEGKFTCHTLHHILYDVVTKADGSVAFQLKDPREFKGIQLIVVDECSMVTEEILSDLLSLGIKVLFVGDHGQLEPIGKQTWLYKKLQQADFTLTEIHRQAEGNPIIHLSMLARQGKRIKNGNYDGKVFVAPKNLIKTSQKMMNTLVRADQVICGYNKTRNNLNKKIRKELGLSGDLPVVGDKLICLRNNWGKSIPSCSLVNGLIGHAKHIKDNPASHEYRSHLNVVLQPEFTDQEVFHGIKILPDKFRGQEIVLAPQEYGKYDDFDFGYAITCHKSQGSQWDNIVVVNEAFGDEPSRWLYTAITRASNKLVLCN